MRWFAIVALTLLALGCGAYTIDQELEPSEKDEAFFNDYFEVKVEKQTYMEGYQGWLNYTTTITCKNGTDQGPDLFPYQTIEYVLAVRDYSNILEQVASTSFVYVPGNCFAEAQGRYYVGPHRGNLTLVHMFRAEHSRIPAKEHLFHTQTPTPEVYSTDGLIQLLENFLLNTTAVLMVGVGASLFTLGIIIYFFMGGILPIFISFIGLISTIFGVVVGVN